MTHAKRLDWFILFELETASNLESLANGLYAKKLVELDMQQKLNCIVCVVFVFCLLFLNFIALKL